MAYKLQPCPICQSLIDFNVQYPRCICNSCIRKARDEAGESVIFFHARFEGRDLQGYIRRNNELRPFTGNVCYINGIKCLANYDSENGIMVQPAYFPLKGSFVVKKTINRSLKKG